MAQIAHTCHDCGHEGSATLRQRITGSGLAWSVSFRCPQCGNDEEIDGQGLPPAEMRAEILAQDGVWELVLVDAANALEALGRLRREMRLSMADMARMKRRIPGPILRGTQTEMTFINSILAKNGAGGTVQPTGNDSESPDLT